MYIFEFSLKICNIVLITIIYCCQYHGTVNITFFDLLVEQMLGENLYPLVGRLTPNNQTAKVTGMLLELDKSEVIHLIKSPEELKMKVSEAMEALRFVSSGPACRS